MRPEERVRIALMQKMVSTWGYPPSLIIYEKALHKCMSGQLQPFFAPSRRVDLLVCTNRGEPLLLIECKAIPLNKRAEEQVIGYNSVIQAPFIALVNQHEARTGYLEGGSYQFVEGFFPYQTLKSRLSSEMVGEEESTTALSTTLESSRTLPGQAYP